MIAVMFLPTAAYAASEADEITYKTDKNEEVYFKGSDFNRVCKDLTGDKLDYVKFILPSESKGILFYDYDGKEEEEVSKSDKCYYNDDWDLSEIAFVPAKNYTGTVTITYTGCDVDDYSFTGTVKITVGTGSSGDVEYSVDADDTVDFREKDFNNYCKDENGKNLDYVYFSIPSSSKGKLYYDYDGKKEKKISDSEKYYYGYDPSIDDITFAADKNFSGEVIIEFTGKDENGKSISGDIVITVKGGKVGSAKDISYSGNAGANIRFNNSDFNSVCKDLTKNDLDYVKFTLPSSSTGKLYYDYTSSSNYDSAVSSSTKYYEDSKPYIGSVTFVPYDKNLGNITLEYTGYDTDGDEFSGKIQISYKAVFTNTSSLYFTDVSGDFSWAVLYVDSLYSSGVLSGTAASDGTMRYNPAVKITRGDFMLYLYKAMNLPNSTAAGSFSDVPAGSTYYTAITAAKALGIAKGSDNVFGINTAITREDAMVLAQRAITVTGMGYMQGDASTLTAFSDYSQVSDYARDAIATLIKSGIITGNTEKQLYPKSNISRAEAAAMIYRIKF